MATDEPDWYFETKEELIAALKQGFAEGDTPVTVSAP